MTLTRRSALTALGAAVAIPLAAPSVVRAADRGARRFTVIRDGDDIGFQTNAVTRRGDVITHECQARLKVKVLGITAYRYELDYVEEWRSGELVSMKSTCYDDGEDAFANVKRAGDGLEVSGSGYSGPCPLGVATSSYWSIDFMQRPIWISTQSGELMNMSARKAGAEEIETTAGPVSAEKWSVTGAYDVDVYYQRGEWVSIGFDAGGERAVYVPDQASQQFSAVWAG